MHLITFLIISIGILFSTAFSQEVIPVITLEDDAVTWSPTSSEAVEIHVAEGYQIQIDVTKFDVDGENDNYVTVKEVTDDEEETNEIMLTYTVGGKPSYLYNTDKIQVTYVGTNEDNELVLKFTRAGELVTTTTIITTTTEEVMPTPAPEEEATLTVFLYGRAAADFGSAEIRKLREKIGEMGSEYCNFQTCPLNESITYMNVKIETLTMCSVMWEDYDSCVLLTFALPIKKRDDDVNPLWSRYQLNESHLKIMWDTYASQYMGQIGLSLYAIPDLNKIFNYRIIIICLVIVMLVILILVTRHVTAKIRKKRRRLSDTICIMDQSSDRISQMSLPPHYLQELPPHLREQRNYAEYHMTYMEDDDKTMPQSIINQRTTSSDVHDLEDE